MVMNLQEVIKAIDRFSPEELRAYLDRHTSAHTLSPEERIRRLDEAAKAIRESFTNAEWAETESAMNEEFIGTR